MDIIVRKAESSDESRVFGLVRELDLSHPMLKLENFIVVEEKGDIVGVAHVEDCGENIYLSAVGVREDRRRRGVARALVSAVLCSTTKDVYIYTLERDIFAAIGFVDESPPDDIPPREVYDCQETCDPDLCHCMVIKRQ